MRFYFVLFVLTIMSLNSSAQIGMSRSLRVGDTLPDIEIENIINFQSSKVRTKDFKGKLLILDFWATWCSPCVASFPKNDSLQKKFEGNVLFLPITSEKREDVVFFANKMKAANGITITSVTDDSLFMRMFKHKYLPHYVWINSNGKIIAITDGAAITESNVIGALSHVPFKFDLKDDNEKRSTAGISLFAPQTSIRYKDLGYKEIELVKSRDKNILISSVLTKYLEGHSSSASFRDSTYIAVKNANIEFLYRIALLGNKRSMLNATTFIAEISDSSLHSIITGSNINGLRSKPNLAEIIQWQKLNTYCYQLIVPDDLVSRKYQIMLNQLNQYFGQLYGIEGKVVKRRQKYLALVLTGSEKKLVSDNQKTSTIVNKFYLKITNGTLGTLIRNLAIPLQKHPQIFDETGVIDRIDLEISCDLSDLSELNNQLEKYNLRLIEKEKEMNVAVVSAK